VFSFGFMEIAVICLLAVILFPPRELPKLARSVARFYGTIRRTADDFRAAIMEDPDLNEPIDEIKSAYRQTRWEVRRAEEATRRELAKARMDARMAARGATGSAPPAGDASSEDDPEPRAGQMQGRVAAGELEDELDQDFDGDFDHDLEMDAIEDPEDVHGPIGAPAAPPLVPPPPPLSVAPDPDDDPGGGRSDRSQGAA
jgi:Sec-independent protein translocase protein TatA